MNISYNWLKDLIDSGLTPQETADQLTRVGLTVEGVEPHGDDFVLDIDLTSNRSDCLSHLGVARELGVITNKGLKIEASTGSTEDIDLNSIPFPSVLAPEIVRIESPDLCHRFTARIIRNVKIGPSPDWLVKRLEAVGERSINNVADITNYVMHELGQPLHSFDLDKLYENRIIVRNARNGEKITTLDEVERKLDDSMVVICDAEKPIAIGGIMGGFDSSITDNTVNVLLEVAYFKRENIRQTSRKLGLATEASYRFERGVDIQNLIRASDRAAELICEIAGGNLADFVDIYPTKFKVNTLNSNDISKAVERLTGLQVETVECLRILNALGINIVAQSGTANTFTSPSWRHDITIEEDLVEEIARHIGYENIAEELPPAYGAGEYQASESQKKLLRLAMVNTGFDEALSYSFIDTKFDEIIENVPGLTDKDAGEKFIALQDSIIDGAVRMRPTLIPGLLEAVRLNFNHQRKDIRLFEIGKAFAAIAGDRQPPAERELFSFILTGSETIEGHATAGREYDFYDAKGLLEAALEAVGFSHADFLPEIVKHLRRGQSASVWVNDKKIGFLGRINEEIAADYKFKQSVYVAEIDLQTVLAETGSPVIYRALPRFPSVVRDVSLIANRIVGFSDIRTHIASETYDNFQTVSFVDIYEGKGMQEDERSMTIRLEYRNDERTLTDEEVTAVHDKIVENLETGLGVKLRY